MENINDIIEYIESNKEYMDSIDNIVFGVLKKSIRNRPKGLYVPPDVYLEWMKDDIKIGRLKQCVEAQKILVEQQKKEESALSEKEVKKNFEERRNIKRDNKGRLNKGALLAKKDSCNESKIYLMHEMGATVKEIVKHYGCSKSVVYRILAKHK